MSGKNVWKLTATITPMEDNSETLVGMRKMISPMHPGRFGRRAKEIWEASAAQLCDQLLAAVPAWVERIADEVRCWRRPMAAPVLQTF